MGSFPNEISEPGGGDADKPDAFGLGSHRTLGEYEARALAAPAPENEVPERHRKISLSRQLLVSTSRRSAWRLDWRRGEGVPV